MKNLNKRQNLVEQARINLDKEKISHSITQVRVEELESIINKAIEYIEDNLYPVGNDVNGSDLPYDEAIQPLVDILKGSDKE